MRRTRFIATQSGPRASDRRMPTPVLGAMGLSLLLTVLSLAFLQPVRVRAADTHTGFVIDSPAGESFGGGELFDFDPSVLTGTGTVDNFTTVNLEGNGWRFRFISSGRDFALQTYQFLSNGRMYLWRDDDPCGNRDWSFEVLEVPVFATTGELVSFAADFRAKCFSGEPDLFGSVRFNSAIPTRLLRVTSVTFPDTYVGESSLEQRVEIENVGSSDVVLQPMEAGGTHPDDFPIVDGCGFVSLDPGQNCYVSVRFAPSASTDRTATGTIAATVFGGQRVASFSGYGLSLLTKVPSALVIHSAPSLPGGGEYFLDPVDMTGAGTAREVDLQLPGWRIQFFAPTDESLGVGRYENVGYPQTSDTAGFLLTSSAMCGSSATPAWFEVLDGPVFDTDGTLLRFAADFGRPCGTAAAGARGWVRYHSALPVPKQEDVGYSIEMNRVSARAGDVITLTPRPTGTQLFAFHRCQIVIESDINRSDFSRMAVASDDCTPWTFTLPASIPDGYRVWGTYWYGDFGEIPFRSIAAPEQGLTILVGGAPVPFATNYPVQSWTPADLIVDETPTYGAPQTIRPPAGADGCQLTTEAGFEGIWTVQDNGCIPWTFTLPAPKPNVAPGLFLPSFSVHSVGWTGTSAWSDDRRDAPFYGSRWGATFRASLQPYSGTGGQYASNLPAIFAGDARYQVFYTDDPTSHTFAPVVVGASGGSCTITPPLVVHPVANGGCGTYDVPPWPFQGHGTSGVYTELHDESGHLVAGGGSSFGFIERQAPLAIEVVSTGSDVVAIKVATTSGAPASYAIDVTWTGGAAQQFTGDFTPSITSDGDDVTVTPILTAGAYVVTARFTDVKGDVVSSTKNITIDRTGPVGAIAIAGGATYTTTRAVSIAVGATDSSGVTHVALSNDGVTWVTGPYQAVQAWTLPGTTGTRTVWAKWRDAAGNWSLPKSDSIILDASVPTIGAGTPTAAPSGALAATGTIPLTLSWKAMDAGTGIARYRLEQSTDGGPWVSIGSALTTPASTRTLTAGHTYAFRVQAIDVAGNVSGWRTVGPFRATLLGETTSRATYVGAWASISSSAFTDGRARRTSAANARVTYAFTGSAVAWVASRGPTGGAVKVYVDGSFVTTVDLRRASTSNRQVVFSRSWTTRAPHTITLINTASAGHPYANVDGFISFDGLPRGAIGAAR